MACWRCISEPEVKQVMGGFALVTICVALFASGCKGEGVYTYPEAFPTHHEHPKVVYVPVCTPECFKSPHQSHFSPKCEHKADLGYHQESGEAYQHLDHHNPENLGSAEVYQQIDHHASEHKHSIHHHGSGESHLTFKQEHHEGLELGQHQEGHEHHHDKDKNIHYQFEYSVNDHKTGDVKRHKEERKGDVVNGEYSLLEEDGNVRTVKYFADWKTGFHAQVHNSKPRAHG